MAAQKVDDRGYTESAARPHYHGNEPITPYPDTYKGENAALQREYKESNARTNKIVTESKKNKTWFDKDE